MSEPNIDLNSLLSVLLKEAFKPYADEINRLNDVILSLDARVTAAFNRINLIEHDAKGGRVTNLAVTVPPGSGLDLLEERIRLVEVNHDLLTSHVDNIDGAMDAIIIANRDRDDSLRKVESAVTSIDDRIVELETFRANELADVIDDRIDDRIGRKIEDIHSAQVERVVQSMCEDEGGPIHDLINSVLEERINPDDNDFCSAVFGIQNLVDPDSVKDAVRDVLGNVQLRLY